MDMNCCNASGPRGQFTLPLTAVMSTKNGLAVNFYVDGSYKLKTPSGNRVTVVQNTDYPVSGTIAISLKMEREEEMTFQLRIPEWSKMNTLTVNSKQVPGIVPGKYVDLENKWSSKDVIKLELDMRGRVEMQGDEDGKFAVILRGPMVLARDSRLGGPHLNTVNRPVTNKKGYIELKNVQGDKESWMICTASFVPEAYTEAPAEAIDIPLVDYASAGNGKEQSTFQVWLPQLYSGRIN